MSDAEDIKNTIKIYFDSMFESDPDKARVAFHRDAKITGYTADGLVEMTVIEFAGFIASQPSAKAAGAEPFLETVWLNIAGDTAVALIRDDYIGNRYIDTLSLLKCDDKWLIYNKLFHIEGPAK